MIGIELSQEDLAVLRAAFGDAMTDDVTSIFVGLATKAWLDWISGSERYSSLTEQYTHWVEQLYTSLLPEDEPPSTERLYSSFNFPYGQAQYIARVLGNKALTRWRMQARTVLVERLREKKPEVDKWLNDEKSIKPNDSRTVHITLDRLGYQELKIELARLYRLDRERVIPPKAHSDGNLVSVSISPLTFQRICEMLSI